MEKFRYCCVRLLPISIDQSLSDYEFLCKVVQYLNEVIDELNKMGATVEGLTEAFNTLKEYVDNFFNNLNVQEEVNNKINQMVTDGTFDTIFSKLFKNNFDSINEKFNQVNADIVATNARLDSLTITDDQIYNQSLVDETGFIFASLPERFESRHNGVVEVTRLAKPVTGSSRFVTDRMKIGSVPLAIKGNFLKQVTVYDTQEATTGTIYRAFTTFVIILKGNEGKWFDVETTPQNSVNIVFGEIEKKHNRVFGNIFNFNPTGNSTWAASSLISAGRAITVPVKVSTFKELTVSYDAAAFIMDAYNPTVTDPPTTTLLGASGYNRITKDMLPPDQDYVVFCITPVNATQLPNSQGFDEPLRGIGYYMFDKYSIECDYESLPYGFSVTIENNIQTLKDHGGKLLPGTHPNETTTCHYSNDFNGALYSGSTHSGSLFFHITPAMYYTALLNPFSCAYGNVKEADMGYLHYGLVCSKLTTLLCGIRIPYTTMDYVYNKNLVHGTVKPLNLLGNIFELPRYTIMTQRYQQSGHCVMLEDEYAIDRTNFLKVIENVQPATRESVFPLDNGFGNYLAHTNPLDFYVGAYDYYTEIDYSKCNDISKMNDWVNRPYIDSQLIMCNRGYGGLYVNVSNRYGKKLISVKNTVTNFTMSVNSGAGVNIVVANLTEFPTYDKTFANGYVLYDITDIVNGMGFGRYVITVDGQVEVFYYKDVSQTTVSIDKTPDTWTINVNDKSKLVYYTAAYRFPNDLLNSLIYMPTDNVIPVNVETAEGTAVLIDVNAVFWDEETQCTWWNDGKYLGV